MVRKGRATLAVALACATFLGTVSGATADSGAGAGVIPVIATGELHTLSASLEYKALGALGTWVIAFHCDAVALPTAASTGIGECSVGGQAALNSPNNMPGAASTAVGIAITGDNPAACIEAHAVFMETILGPETLAASDCQDLILVTVS